MEATIRKTAAASSGTTPLRWFPSGHQTSSPDLASGTLSCGRAGSFGASKIYVSGSYHDRDLVADVAAFAEELGFTVTFKWWAAEENKAFADAVFVTPEALRNRRALAAKEILAVRRADVVLQVGRGRLGAATEFGAAIALGKRVLAILPGDAIARPDRSIFWYHPSVELYGVDANTDVPVFFLKTKLRAKALEVLQKLSGRAALPLGDATPRLAEEGPAL
jgi:hypothetical protein